MRAKIFYFTLQDEQTKEEKLDWFERARFEQIPFDHITPDQRANWMNLTDNDFDSFLPLIARHRFTTTGLHRQRQNNRNYSTSAYRVRKQPLN